MLERRNLVSLFSFLIFFAIISYFYACNNTNENLVTSPSKTVMDNNQTTPSCTENYQGGCYVTHRCFWVSQASGCSYPPFRTPGQVTVKGTDCENSSFTCTYNATPIFEDDDVRGSFGNFFPNGTYEVKVCFDDGIGTIWECTKTLTFKTLDDYNPYFCMTPYNY